ncbi:MAG: CopG family transcriptional regulator [Candidatus Thorarchaeota archaeon]
MKVEISDKIAKKIEERIRNGEFKTIDEYIEFIVNQVIEKIEKTDKPKKEEFSKEDEKKVEDRLRGLGYVD